MKEYKNNVVWQCPYCNLPADGENDPLERCCWKCAEPAILSTLDGRVMPSVSEILEPKFTSTNYENGKIEFNYYKPNENYYIIVSFAKKSLIGNYYCSIDDFKPSRGIIKVPNIDPKIILNKMLKLMKMKNFR